MRKLGIFGLWLALAAGCGDDGGTDTTTDLPTDDGGPMPMADGGPGGADGFAPDPCDGVACGNGVCVADGATAACECDAGWRGDACDTLDAPEAGSITLWLDASDATLRDEMEGRIASLLDKSGNDNHLVQLGEGAQPTVGMLGELEAARFDGIDDSLQLADFDGFSSRNDFTLFLVVHSEEFESALLSADGEVHERLALIDNTNWVRFRHRGGDSGILTSGRSLSGAYDNERAHVITFERTTRYTSVYVDGVRRRVVVSEDEAQIPELVDLTLGNGSFDGFLRGEVGEVIATGSATPPAERARIESYLGAKWSVDVAHDASTFGNLFAWWDAAQVDPELIEDGRLTGWNSVMGSPDLTTLGPGNRPELVADGLGGLPVVRFDGVDNRVVDFDNNLFTVPNWSVAMVIRRDSITDGGSLMNLRDIDGTHLELRLEGNAAILVHDAPIGDAVEDQVSGVVPDDETLILIVTHKPGTKVLDTGASVESVRPDGEMLPAADFRLGGYPESGPGNPFAGDMAEVMVFQYELTDDERDELRRVLERKWGLAD